MSSNPPEATARPDHVAADRVIDFDYFNPPGIEEGDVYSAWRRLQDGPEIVWTNRNGGHWILTRGEDIKWVQENFEVFSHEEFAIPRLPGKIFFPPLTTDPPLHARYRSVLNPSFAPARIRELSDDIRALTVELVEELRGKPDCDFVTDFAQVMPVSIFLRIVDLPSDRRKEFVEWASTYIGTSDPAVKQVYIGKIGAYLGAVLQERGENPGNDLLSHIANWRNHRLFGGEAEVFGMAMLVFLGGLDTVANMMSFTVRHLAEHPEQRRRLRENPDIIPQAAEEFLRRFGLSNTGRIVRTPTDYKGVHFAVDDMVMVPISLSSMDDRLYDRPLEVDFDREPVAHNTFGNAPHRCVGAPLARSELQIFLEEWLTRIPEFGLDPARPPITHSGPVNGVSSLPLIFGEALRAS